VTRAQPDAASLSTDAALAGLQLGRPVRGMVAVAHRCPCGAPDVVTTAPRLDDGTPFPTTFYLTCPRAASAVGTLEAGGLMREMTRRLGSDPELADAYRRAHEDYLRRRSALGEVPELAGVSAGGMPDRVKCLHVLVAHALAAGPGVNPLGDEVLAALPPWWAAGPCVDPATSAVRPGGTVGTGGRAGADWGRVTGPDREPGADAERIAPEAERVTGGPAAGAAEQSIVGATGDDRAAGLLTAEPVKGEQDR
jgi:hypothetical protein